MKKEEMKAVCCPLCRSCHWSWFEEVVDSYGKRSCFECLKGMDYPDSKLECWEGIGNIEDHVEADWNAECAELERNYL